MSVSKFAVIPSYIPATAMTATITGSWIPIYDKDNVSIQVVTTNVGSPVGAITFETTNAAGIPPTSLGGKIQPPSTAPVSTLDMTSAQTTAATISSNAISYAFRFTNVPDAWVRMVYTRASGGTAATLSAGACVKAV